MRIARVGVIGAGAMGSGIAALAASAGFPVTLLDVPGDADRDAAARAGVQRALKARPPQFMSPDRAALIDVGNTADDLGALAECDWIIEAIIEQPGPKRQLFEQLESIVKPTAIVSTNTSAIPVRSLVETRSDAFRARFLGTHFFNPPRYLHLLELIPTERTTPDVVAAIRAFGERLLGKGIVIARDVPGFIANRLGIHGFLRAIRLMEEFDLTIDEVDALTGPLIGRARSATFRTGDISGIDVLSHVASGLSATTGEEFTLPAWVRRLVTENRLGEKSGAGFYRKVGKDIQTLNWKTGDYTPASKPQLRELEYLQPMPLEDRLHALTTAGGRHAEFLRKLLLFESHYTLTRTPDIAPDIVAVDRAMEWGYAWDRGPFKQMDAMGLEFMRGGFGVLGLDEPPLLRTAQESFYRRPGNGERYLTFSGQYSPVDEMAGHLSLDALRLRNRVMEATPDAAIYDVGDGVLLVEFRSKMNSLGEGVLRTLEAALDRADRGKHTGVIIGNDDPRTFTAGADLSLVMRRIAAGEWKALEDGVAHFQRLVTSLRRTPYPVVVAPFGLTLGGGAELTLHASRVQAHAELYVGLVEVGVGLIPAGGGTKELLFRFAEELATYDESDPFEAVRRAFKVIATATTSTSALDARRLGFLRDGDRVSMNRDHLLGDAKARVLELARDYTPPPPRRIRALGREAIGNLAYAVWAMREAGQATDHDVLIGHALARVLAGGDGPPRDVSENDILELEREAFLSLLGTQETQQRIEYTLKTGKPLRN
ncbi:MAG TPA: 3-hydroxyacyl-CoA dehydrogenase/enoyl-CoA hydratase family protein [Gemmatimonadaceae bacterium]|jgi:3-hydroxyacyl-CoA dehydrogenase|nr:3-hydroxyacyl-CoA dehydrogenase/enoyl-CoA hydratase family protein [Gemmatimonadaceae bacterium]